MDFTVRRRARDPIETSWTTKHSTAPAISGVFEGYRTIQETGSEGHPFRLLGRSGRDIGGPFWTATTTVREDSGAQVFTSTATGNRFEDGLLLPHETPRKLFRGLYDGTVKDSWQASVGGSSVHSMASDLSLDSLGSTAMARTHPTNPVSDVAVSIGELREGLPSIPGTSGNIGSEFLNIQFGVLPSIDDIANIKTAYQQSDKLLRQLNRDSGRLVRRRYSFPDEVTTEKVVTTDVFPTYVRGVVLATLCQKGTLTTTTKKVVKTSYSGACTYYLPPIGTWRRKLAELDYLYGLQPGLDTAWELTPWSWLVDWQSNFGDVLKNISALSEDGLVYQYAYVMQQVETTVEHQWQGNTIRGGSLVATTVSSSVRCVSKQRRPATPFGFGLDIGDFSPRQLAILAALGISRA